MTPDGIPTSFAYDSLGRVTNIDRNPSSPLLLGQDYAFAYDNGDSAVSCPTAYLCANRVGRLARVSIEYAPGSFWQMYYDYASDGQVGSERWPDGRETVYEYANTLLNRMHFPARPGDSVRYDHDATTGDQHDPTEVRSIVGERTGSGDIVTWADDIERDSLGRVTKVTPHDSPAQPPEVAWREDGRVFCWWVYRRDTPTTYLGVADRCNAFSSDGSTRGYGGIQHVWRVDAFRVFHGSDLSRCMSHRRPTVRIAVSTELVREMTLLNVDGSTSQFTVRIGPTERRADGQWWAPILIDGLWETRFSIEVAGVDEVQAVKHAFQALGAKLTSTAEYAAGRLYWLHPDLGHGFS